MSWSALKASTRLTPDDIDDWLIILNLPISAVLATCVPPHNSVEKYLFSHHLP